MYIFICFEILNILAIDKNFCKRGGNVTECLVKGLPTRGFPPNIPVTGDSPYWDLPPSL